MIRDYDHITPEQEAAETLVFEQWFDWFFEKYDISQDTELLLDDGEIRTIRQYKEMLMNRFPLQENTLTYLPGVAAATDRAGLRTTLHSYKARCLQEKRSNIRT